MVHHFLREKKSAKAKMLVAEGSCTERSLYSGTIWLAHKFKNLVTSIKIYGNGARGFRTPVECNPFEICEPVF